MNTTLGWMLLVLSACSEETEAEPSPREETEAATPAPEAEAVAAGAEGTVRNYIDMADVAVIGEFVGTTEVYGPGRAAKARALIAAGRWAGTPPPDETLGRHSARRIRVIHRAKGPASEEILLMGGRAGWTEGQRIILFGLAGDPTDEFPENLYYDQGEMFNGLCVRSGVPLREKLESCQGRFKVPWDELESIVVAQSVSDARTAYEVLRCSLLDPLGAARRNPAASSSR